MQISKLQPLLADRPLTDEERRLTGWMLEHGATDARAFLPQLDRARVVSCCACGCASIDFEIAGGFRPASGAMRILGDFLYGEGDGLRGVFIFERGGVLAGLEVYSPGGDTPAGLPAPDALRPFGDA
jgi:hypothetical protein